MHNPLAKKRSVLKRYLAASGLSVASDSDTLTMQTLVRELHKQSIVNGRGSYSWPITRKKLEEICQGNHYLSQLFAMKDWRGPQASIGCLHEGKNHACKTVADLIRVGFVGSHYAYLDHHFRRHELMEPIDASNESSVAILDRR